MIAADSYQSWPLDEASPDDEPAPVCCSGLAPSLRTAPSAIAYAPEKKVVTIITTSTIGKMMGMFFTPCLSPELLCGQRLASGANTRPHGYFVTGI